MVAACREQGVPEPEYEVMESFVKIIFRKPATLTDESKEKSKEKGKEKGKEKTTDKIFRLITENPYITTSELADQCGIGENSVYKAVRKLREAGRIQRIGGDKGGKWETYS